MRRLSKVGQHRRPERRSGVLCDSGPQGGKTGVFGHGSGVLYDSPGPLSAPPGPFAPPSRRRGIGLLAKPQVRAPSPHRAGDGAAGDHPAPRTIVVQYPDSTVRKGEKSALAPGTGQAWETRRPETRRVWEVGAPKVTAVGCSAFGHYGGRGSCGRSTCP